MMDLVLPVLPYVLVPIAAIVFWFALQRYLDA
jgi:hypothetical protein